MTPFASKYFFESGFTDSQVATKIVQFIYIMLFFGEKMSYNRKNRNCGSNKKGFMKAAKLGGRIL